MEDAEFCETDKESFNGLGRNIGNSDRKAECRYAMDQKR